MNRHAIRRLQSLAAKAVPIMASKLRAGVIAAVNRKRIFLGVLLEQSDYFRVASPPIPRDECDIGRKPVTLHHIKELVKVDEPIAGLQQRIVNH